MTFTGAKPDMTFTGIIEISGKTLVFKDGLLTAVYETAGSPKQHESKHNNLPNLKL